MNPAPQQLDSAPTAVADAGADWRVPGWAVVPAVAAPVVLLAGITVSPALQPPEFDSVRDTISSLAARDAGSHAVMTAALIGLGLSYVATAIGLVGARLVGRVLLGAGGVGTALVGVFPLPTGTGGSVAHATSALLSVSGITLWPFGLIPRRSDPAFVHRPFAARMPVNLCATAALLLLFAWFGLEQWTRWGHVGLSERVAALGQAIWPLIVVLTARAQRATGQHRRQPVGSSAGS